jgi:tetratricopeptide (TPR) repeat protein
MEFLAKFEGTECALDETSIPYDETMDKPLLLLAKAYEKSGEYHKIISIYIYLMENSKKSELLEQLGKVYLRAGFLQRAESIFLEVLSKQPREKQTLYQLGVVYEMLQQYDKAMETLEPLEMLGENINSLRSFWEFEKIHKSQSLSASEKEAALLSIQQSNPTLYRHTISALFELNPQKAWDYLDPQRLVESLDLLWYLPKHQLDFDIILSDERLTKIYFARGIIEEITPKQRDTSSVIISIDILAAARSVGERRGNLSFTYLCGQCKQSFPISFNRCPNCLAINSAHAEEHIVKHEETDYSIF